MLPRVSAPGPSGSHTQPAIRSCGRREATGAAKRTATLSLLAVLACTPLWVRLAWAAWPHQSAVNLPVCTAGNPQLQPAIISDNAGGAIATWSDQRTGSADIYAQHILASGVVDPAWPANGRVLCNAANDQQNPTIAPDGAGGAIVTWMDFRLGGWDIYAQHVLPSGVVDPGWPVNGRAVCSAFFYQQYPTIVSDGAGGAIVSWFDFRSSTSDDIYAQHVFASGSIDPTWPADGRLLCGAAGNQQFSRLVSDGAGGAIVAWQDSRSGNIDIYAQHVLASGSVDGNWPVDGRAVCTAGNNQINPALIADGSGGALITWQDGRSGSDHIYAQHLLASGAVDSDPGWPLDGRAVCTAGYDQQSPAIAGDGANGAIIAWQDRRVSTAYHSIYAQRLLASGAPAWLPVDGVLLDSGVRDGASPVIVSDGAGGAIVGWCLNGSDISAQHVTGAGVADAVWPVGGLAVSTASNTQTIPAVVSDGSGGAILAWQDNRSGNIDVYAQRVAAFGRLGTPEPEIAGVKDVPNDQGGRVKISWNASWLDVDPSQIVSHYWIFRSVPTAIAEAARMAGRPVTTFPTAARGDGRPWLATREAGGTTYWEFVANQDALHVLDGYSALVPTANDSAGSYNPTTLFMVTALNAAGTQYWSSSPAAGYSVDNLAPGAPAALAGNFADGATHLHWNPNREADLAGYRVYRGESPDFAPGSHNLLAVLPDTGYADAGPTGGFYKVSAIDRHGNESGFALLTPTSTGGVPGSAGRLGLEAPNPNPAFGLVAIRFSLPREGRVELSAWDAAGRWIRTLIAEDRRGGTYTTSWDLCDRQGRLLPAGSYYLRLAFGTSRSVRRVVVLR